MKTRLWPKSPSGRSSTTGGSSSSTRSWRPASWTTTGSSSLDREAPERGRGHPHAPRRLPRHFRRRRTARGRRRLRRGEGQDGRESSIKGTLLNLLDDLRNFAFPLFGGVIFGVSQ